MRSPGTLSGAHPLQPLLGMVTAGEFCNRTVIIAHPAETLLDAAKRMRDEHVGSLVVVEDLPEGRRPIGMLTDRDMVVAVLGQKGQHVESVSVGDVMSKEVVRAWEDEPLIDVLKRMRSFGIRRVPVVDSSDCLSGLICFDDLVEQIADEMHDLATLITFERNHERRRESHASGGGRLGA